MGQELFEPAAVCARRLRAGLYLLEKEEIRRETGRKRYSLPAATILQRKYDIALCDPVRTEEVRRLVRTSQGRTHRNEQAAKQYREDDKSRNRSYAYAGSG
jgi:hypothetical protein